MKIMKNLLHKRHLILIYNAYLKSLLDYCSPLFIGLPSARTKPIMNLQKKAVRIISRTNNRAHTKELFIELGLLPFKKLVLFNTARFMFLYMNKKVPAMFDDTWKLNRDMRTRELRNDNDFSIQFTNKQYLKSLPLFDFPSVWNNLPADIKSLQDKNLFNRKLFLHLLLTD